MPDHVKTITVTFSGITFDDTIGFGQDVNQSYSFPFRLHKDSGVSSYNGVVGEINVYILTIVDNGGQTRVIHELTPQSDLSNRVPVFDGTAETGGVIPNSLSLGGQSTVTME